MQRRWAKAATLVVAALPLLAACGDSDSSKPANGAVSIQLISFKPESVVIDAGTALTWTQNDPGVHTVTSGTVDEGAAGVTTVPDGRFDSGEVATGKTFTITFDKPGTYPYYCSVHPATMRGEVRVK